MGLDGGRVYSLRGRRVELSTSGATEKSPNWRKRKSLTVSGPGGAAEGVEGGDGERRRGGGGGGTEGT